MKKIPLATQIPVSLKKQLDVLCAEEGMTISHLTTQALQDKIDSIKEDKMLLKLAIERLAEPGEYSYKNYKQILVKSRG